VNLPPESADKYIRTRFVGFALEGKPAAGTP
jgi:hypothetical protein